MLTPLASPSSCSSGPHVSVASKLLLPPSSIFLLHPPPKPRRPPPPPHPPQIGSFASASCSRRDWALPPDPACGRRGRDVGADADFTCPRSLERGRAGSCGGHRRSRRRAGVAIWWTSVAAAEVGVPMRRTVVASGGQIRIWLRS